jgi:hypothetical protein
VVEWGGVWGMSWVKIFIIQKKLIYFSDTILKFSKLSHLSPYNCTDHKIDFAGQVIEDLRERFFGPSFELMSHDKVSDN